MASFLYFRSQFNKISESERLFLMLRLRQWLLYEYTKKHSLDGPLIKHMTVSHCLWNEFWWRRLRELSKAPAFVSMIRSHF